MDKKPENAFNQRGTATDLRDTNYTNFHGFEITFGIASSQKLTCFDHGSRNKEARTGIWPPGCRAQSAREGLLNCRTFSRPAAFQGRRSPVPVHKGPLRNRADGFRLGVADLGSGAWGGCQYSAPRARACQQPQRERRKPLWGAEPVPSCPGWPSEIPDHE